jgi:UDP-N-acetylglucosamine acyltransferase
MLLADGKDLREQMANISPHAIVEDTAKIADDVVVGPFSYIGGQVEIAAGCAIANNVTITGRTTLGEKNHVFPMAVIGTGEDDGGKVGRCILGEANSIREHVTIYAGVQRETRIGSDNLIMIGCVVGGGARIADHGIFDNCAQIGPGAAVEDYVRMSAFAEVQAGCMVGEYTFVTGYAGVDRNAPPYAMVQGFPMRIRGVNTRNLKRCGFGDDDIKAIKTAFRELFNGAAGTVNADALAKYLEDSNAHLRRLAEVVKSAEAGGQTQ